MKITWLILLVAFTFLPTLLAGAKKARVGRSIEADSVDAESDEEDMDDGFFSFDAEESAEEAVEEPSYFTYEAPEPEKKETSSQAPAPVQVVVEEPLQRTVFDLRQAVIYQTVLNNRYINAEN